MASTGCAKKEPATAADFGGGFVLPTSFELTRTSWAPFAEVRLESRSAVHAAGVRVDKPDNADSVTSPRVRVAYEIADTGFTIAGAWGKAFKLPSMYALGHPLVGNPDLKSERDPRCSSCRSRCGMAAPTGARRGLTASFTMPSTSIRVRRPCS
jgi:hypothetical protein